MKVMLCGEGAQDVGQIDLWSIRQERKIQTEGWLQPLLRKLLGNDLEFEIVPRSRLVSFPSGKLRPPGHGRKAMAAKWRAISARCDVLVFMIDADTNDADKWSDKRQQIVDGFAAIPGEVRSVACVPTSTSESWLLSDAAAWVAIGLQDSSALPKRPESLWGEPREPDSDHPHRCFERICGKAGVPDCRATRAELMSRSTLDAIKAKCPIS